MKTIDSNSFFKGFDLPNGIATILESYAKRYLENKYDNLFELPFFAELKKKDKKMRYGIEFGLYVITSLLDQNMKEDTPFKKTLKGILMDSASEISKRLINGLKEIDEGVEKAEITPLQGITQKSFLSTLLELDSETVKKFAFWYLNTNEIDKQSVLREIKKLSEKDLEKFFNLPDETKILLFKMLENTASKNTVPANKKENFWENIFAPFEERMKKYVEKRKRRKEKK